MLSRTPLALVMSLALTISAAAVPSSDTAVTAAMLKSAAVSLDKAVPETPFIHRLFRPANPSGRTIIMLHGSGGDETTLASLAEAIAPDATLIGIRGRIVQDGVKRWYKRITATEFDQTDVRTEADAFVKFLNTLATENRLDLSNVTFLGYSNGANLIAALTQLHPGLVRSAVLLRAMPVLQDAPKVDLSQTRILTIAGERDTLYFPFAPQLADRLRSCGARVDARVIGSDHGLGKEDVRIVAEWLGNTGR